MNKKLLKNVEVFVKNKLGKESSGHDFWHVWRVYNLANFINKKEKANSLVISLAALLHDVGDWKVIGEPEDDYSVAESFLVQNKVNKDIIHEVLYIIKNMSFGKAIESKSKFECKELEIVQDADMLDAIGAIGIARTFAYGGNKGRLIYNPSQEAKIITNEKEYKEASNSTFHHFEEKLLRLKDLMNTKEGKRIAKKRHKFVCKYMKRFTDEWDGVR